MQHPPRRISKPREIACTLRYNVMRGARYTHKQISEHTLESPESYMPSIAGTSTRKSSRSTLDPWELVWGQPYVDAATLAAAIVQDLRRHPQPDFRTRLLVRDSMRALKVFWGPQQFSRWLQKNDVRHRLQTILQEPLGKTGFHAIRRRLVATLRRDDLEQVFQLLGEKVRGVVEINVAGSTPTLLKGLTVRPTDDIDLVDEVPWEIRGQHAILDRIKTKYGLTIGHVQSHYLPVKWRERRHFLGDFGGIRVYLVDEYDVFVSKLSSKQEKHKDDLRVLARKLDEDRIKRLLLTDGRQFLENPHDKTVIEANWRFIFREPLFPQAKKRAARQARLSTDSPARPRKRPRKKNDARE